MSTLGRHVGLHLKGIDPNLLTKGRAVFELRCGPFVRRELEVLAFDGTEESSQLYSYEVLVASSLPGAVLEIALLGSPASLSIMVQEHAPRVVSGMIAWVQHEGADAHGHVFLRVGLVPRMWLLTQRKNCRIFQKQRKKAIIETVLREAGVPCDLRLTREYQDQEYVVQFHETDWDFVTRLCAEDGVFFWFEQPSGELDALTGGLGSAVAGAAGAIAGAVSGDADPAKLFAQVGLGEKVVFSDHTEYPAISDGLASAGGALAAAGAAFGAPTFGLERSPAPELVFRDSSSQPGDSSLEFAYAFNLRRSVRPKATRLREFDNDRPGTEIKADSTLARAKVDPAFLASLAVGSLGANLHLGARVDFDVAALTLEPGKLRVYEPDQGLDPKEVTAEAAKVQLEQQRRDAIAGSGSSWCRRLSAGHRFRLQEHPLDELNQEYVVSRITHKGRVPEYGMTQDGHAQTYTNEFDCVPARLPLRPPLPPRNMNQVLETAIVVGLGSGGNGHDKAGQELYTGGSEDGSSAGQIKVQFHWDLEGKRNEHSSCWIRVAQVMAGDAFGFQFIPRVGMEVLVSFLNGDAQRPIVIGCVPNGRNHLPYADKPEISAIRTRSLPGGSSTGANELRFDDTKDREQLVLHAQRDLAFEADHEHVVKVGEPGENKEKGRGVQRLSIGADQVVEIGRDAELRVRGDQRAVLEGGRTELIKGDKRLTVRGDRDEHVDGLDERTVGKSATLSIKGAYVQRIDDELSVTVKDDEEHNVGREQRIRVERSSTISTGEDFAVNAAREVLIEAHESMRFVCGDSMIELLPDKVRIWSPNIDIIAKKHVEISTDDNNVWLGDKGLDVRTSEHIQLNAPKIGLYAKGANLRLLEGAGGITAEKKVVLFSEKGAALDLAENAAMDGKKVQLNCKKTKDQEITEAQEVDPYDTTWFELELVEEISVSGKPDDRVKVPVAGARYVVLAGGKQYHGVLDGEGRARILCRPGEAKVRFFEFDGEAISSL